jgi:hypothetical protein
MNGSWKRKVQGSACVVIATACLVALTGIAPGPVAALWTGGHAPSGSQTVVLVERGTGASLSGHSVRTHLHGSLMDHRTKGASG